MLNATRTGVRCLSALLILAAVVGATRAHAFSAGITSDLFGPLGCNTCHSGGNTPTVSLLGPSQVPPGSTNEYQLKIAVTGKQNKGGLNAAATDGTLSVGGGASTGTQQVVGAGGRAEITHTGAKSASGGFVTFSFLWTAPDDFTSVTLNAWGNAVNGDGTSLNDKAVLATKEITPGTSTGTECALTPEAGCRKPTKPGAAVFQLKHKVGKDDKDALTYTWAKGDATVVGDFGDPVTGGTDYILCVYDSTSTLVMTASVPARGTCGTKPCWAPTKTGFKYKSKDLTPDGVQQVVLTAGVAGKAKVQVKGKGENLLMPDLPLTQSLTVKVQLINADGVCWEADYSAPAKKNDSTQFNDKSD